MDHLCRLCMQEHSGMKEIFHKHQQYEIAELINQFIPEIVLEEKEIDLSQFICEVNLFVNQINV